MNPNTKTSKTMEELANELADTIIMLDMTIAEMDRATSDIDQEIHDTEQQLEVLHTRSLDIAGEYLIDMSRRDAKIDELKAQIVKVRNTLKLTAG